MTKHVKIAAILPAYKVTEQILSVLSDIGPEFTHIIVVDDKCPDGSGKLVEEQCSDPRVSLIFNEVNKGVGGAVIAGYKRALEEDIDIAVKIDGDGQMDPKLAKRFLQPIIQGYADYTKGNRFQSFYAVKDMPRIRLLGNAGLSFMAKLSSGYWKLFDPTNGYTAIHKTALRQLDLSKINERYFFETDMLVRLGDIRAAIKDVPMSAKYGDEVSNLKIHKVTGDFVVRHSVATFRRILYSYYMRDFNFASLNLLLGSILLMFGTVFGAISWRHSAVSGDIATTGTVMLSVLPIILGFQLLLFFLSFDISNEPSDPLQSDSDIWDEI